MSFAVAALLLAAPPADDPAARYHLAWAAALPWGTAVSVEDFPGPTADAKTAAGLAALAKKGGGVLYFPPGTYTFAAGVAVPNGVILRGADPKEPDARKDGYDPPTKFEFPKYVPAFRGDGTPTATAFKGVTLANPAADSNCGVVNTTAGSGIEIAGDPAGGNVVRNNTHVGPGGWVKNAAAAAVENNTGYEAKK